MEGLINKKLGKTALVIGFSEEEWMTLQLEGEVEYLSGEKYQTGLKTFCDKFANLDPKNITEDDILLSFRPNWWRYAELKRDPSLVITSTD